MPDPQRPFGLEPDVDSRDVATPTTSQRGFPAAPAPAEGPGIGTPWLGSPADPYDPPGGGDADHPHLFHLQNATSNPFEGGSLQGAHRENWPVFVDQKAGVYLVRLGPGGIREPHWHPSAWELNFVVAGRVRWIFVGPDSTQDVFEAGAGDLVFAPQGHFHYFENASDTEDLVVFIAFNSDSTEPRDDIGIAQSISALPPHVLGTVFGVDQQVFADLPAATHRVTITRRRP